MKHIGIVGCSAPGAALCYETISRECETHIEVSMHAHPFGEYMHRIKKDDWPGVAELMLSSAKKLSGIGAQLLIAPCNTIHQAFDMVAPRSPLPWLHIAEEVACEAQRMKLRRVGMLGTRFLMEGPLYASKFEQAGIEHIVPEKHERDRLNRHIFDEMVNGKFTAEARSYVLGIVEQMKQAGCDAVGMCCTELPILLGDAETPLPMLDSTRILARAALQKVAAS